MSEPTLPEVPSLLAPNDFELLRHTLGVSSQHPRGYRNYFVAGGDDVVAMERLRAAGLVIKNERYGLSSDPCYHATIAGAKLVGLDGLAK